MQEDFRTFQGIDSFSSLKGLIDTAEHPIVVAVVSDGCEEYKGQFLTKFEEKLYEQTRQVHYHILCYTEEGMPFPRPSTQVIYYFAPKNYTPLFFRQGADVLSVEVDIATAYSMMDGANYVDAAFDQWTKDQFSRTESMLNAEDVSDYPPLFQQARNFAKEMWSAAKYKTRKLPVLVDADTAYKRLSICQSCEFFKDNSRCQKCGCFMKTKTHLATSTCPIHKW
jgi:hypothetical protein